MLTAYNKLSCLLNIFWTIYNFKLTYSEHNEDISSLHKDGILLRESNTLKSNNTSDRMFIFTGIININVECYIINLRADHNIQILLDRIEHMRTETKKLLIDFKRN